ncbi:MAG: glycine cleavage system transcriptional repressor [Thermoleophilaceae bacterium]|jgi:glycine cleavage system transcriptional repressor|nr:glycine cleavage system transcriptional repressor [Thermoleophilaceae bacterium]
MLSRAMRHFALSAVGRDRPGIVAAITRVLLDHEVNLEDSQMSILQGHFAMMLILGAAGETDEAVLRRDLEYTGEQLGLEAVSLAPLDEAPDAEETAPSHIVSVYGVDHPGIVHAVSSALAERDITITDLETRVVGAADAPIYAVVLEVVLKPGTAAEVEAALGATGGEQGVEVSLRPLEADTL